MAEDSQRQIVETLDLDHQLLSAMRFQFGGHVEKASH
jgi:hypothetical protein